MNNEFSLYLLSIPLAQYRAIRKAIKILVRAGVDYENAMLVILNAHKSQSERRTRYVA